MESLTLHQILEAVFGLLGAAIGVAVIVLALRIAPVLTLFAHKRALRIVVGAALLVVAAELIGVLGPLFRASTFTDVVEEVAELAAISSGGLVLYVMSRSEREEIALLRHSAEVDDLTGLSSRPFFNRAAARRIEFSEANSLPLACIVLDVDDFKDYNEGYGHSGGNAALRSVARVLRESARADDLLTRFGGDEFILLMGGDVEDAVEVAERVRRRVESEYTPESAASLRRRITVSLGVASLTEGTRTLNRLFEAADEAMYHAKRAGKNRILVTGEESERLRRRLEERRSEEEEQVDGP
jgi:diguanylate cyclase (GGDEF)-like protein